MSVRPYIPSYPVIVNGDMSQSSITSKVTIIQKLSLLSYSYSWSGSSPDGSIEVQVSNDFSENAEGAVLNSGTWTALTFNYQGSPTTDLPVSGNTGTGFVDIGPTGAYAIRTVYTKVSGTGTLQAVLNAKVT